MAAGRGVPGARCILRTTVGYQGVTADAEGRFVFAKLREAAVTVSIEADGYARIGPIELLPRTDFPERTFVLGNGLTVTGFVRTQDGDPIEGAQVTALIEGSSGRARTDAAGGFSIAGLSTTRQKPVITLGAFAEGFATAGRQIMPDEVATLTLRKLRYVRLIVQDADTQRAISGARFSSANVVLNAGGDPHHDARILDERRGLYQVGPILPDVAALVVEAEGYAPGTVILDANPGSPQIVRLQLPGSLRGSVFNAPARARITIQAASVDHYGHVETDNSGGFVFESLPPGSYVVFVRQGALATRAQRVEVESGEVSRVDLTLCATYTVSGIVRADDGEPFTKAAVAAMDVDGVVQFMETEASGRLSLAVPPGPLLLCRLSDLAAQKRGADARVTGNRSDLVFDVNKKRPSLRVRPKSAGPDVRLSRVVIVSGLGFYPQSVESGSDGNGEDWNLTPGDYWWRSSTNPTGGPFRVPSGSQGK